MAKAYDIELREKIIQDINQGFSVLEISVNYQVSQSFVYKLQNIKDGDWYPKKVGRKESNIIPNTMLPILKHLVDSHPSSTIDGIRDMWQQKFGIQVSVGTMHRALMRAGVPRRRRSGKKFEDTQESI